MKVAIVNRQRTKKINSRPLREMVAATFSELAITEAELGIRLVGEKEMARVNGQFLQHEGSTDVITFDHTDPLADHDDTHRIHGELFICVDDAVTQAREFGTTWQAEVVRYTVHGILHLLGHDDLQAGPRRIMKRAENRLVRLLDKQFSFAQLGQPRKTKRRSADSGS